MSSSTEEWVRPDEFMKIQLKKQKLQHRFLQQSSQVNQKQQTAVPNPFASQKRNNPFAKSSEQDLKKPRRDLPTASDDTMFELIHSTISISRPNIEASDTQLPAKNVTQLKDPTVDDDDEFQSPEAEPPKPVKILPIDWSIKSRIRILSKTQVVGISLKSSQEASGLTGFVRCLDIKSNPSGLDISDGARFHQNVMYWQYPHLPWLNLVQRNSSSNNQFKMGENESKALLTDWKESFKNIFQLLRTLQCPYYYVLVNQFTVLFRAAGIGGRCEMHALVTPTTRGFRQILKNNDVEFTQPLKEISENSLEMQENDEEDEIKFLESLGIDSSDIKFKEDVKKKAKVEDDNGDLSTVLIEGVDCQAFYNYLLNAKSIVPTVGRLAGVPPTIISPIAFLGGTLKKQTMRTSKLKLEGEDFSSMELRGAILPHTVHTICDLLSDIKNKYSLTLVNYPHTVAFTKTSKKMLEDLDASQTAADHVFGRENLSDCGVQNKILEGLCRVDGEAVMIQERIQYDKDSGGFTLF